MPTKLYVPHDAKEQGIEILWYKTPQTLSIWGWYYSRIGIEGRSFTLAEFFSELGITEEDCKKAFKELKHNQKYDNYFVKNSHRSLGSLMKIPEDNNETP